MDNKDESSVSSTSSSSCDNIESYSSQPHAPCSSHKRKAGRIKFRETRHPVYRGVRQRNGNKWVCEVREPHKKSRIWVGTFPTPEMAARAHDVAALALRGKLASLNFPDSAWLVPRAKSASAKHIRIAANEAVMVFGSLSTFISTPSSSCPSHDLPCLKIEEASIIEDCPCVNISEDQKVSDPSTTSFFDEEALFDMPGLINEMAEGLLLTPPAMQRGFTWDDSMVTDMDSFTLWS